VIGFSMGTSAFLQRWRGGKLPSNRSKLWSGRGWQWIEHANVAVTDLWGDSIRLEVLPKYG
jgi:hypothetical protein